MNVAICLSGNEDIAFIARSLAGELSSLNEPVVVLRAAAVGHVPGVQNIIVGRGHRPGSAGALIDALALTRYMPMLSRSTRLFLLSAHPGTFLVAGIAWMFRRRLYAVVHDGVPHYGGLRGAVIRLHNWIVSRIADALFVFSEYSRAQFARERVYVLPLCSPGELLDTKRQDIRSGRPVAVWWGRAEKYKGISVLPAIANALRRRKADLLVLSDLKKEPRVMRALQDCSNVRVEPERLALATLGDELSRCTANICPYLSCTQSGVVSFSMALGLPTVAFAVGALPEQVRDGVTGHVVERGQVELFADRVVQCATIDSRIVETEYRRTCASNVVAAQFRVLLSQLTHN